MQNILIPDIPQPDQKPFINLTEQTLTLTKAQDYTTSQEKQDQVKELQTQLNKAVYKFYDLTEDEIKVIEGR